MRTKKVVNTTIDVVEFEYTDPFYTTYAVYIDGFLTYDAFNPKEIEERFVNAYLNAFKRTDDKVVINRLIVNLPYSKNAQNNLPPKWPDKKYAKKATKK